MSKLKCNCGNTIHDYQVNLPYKGALIANGSFFDYLNNIEKGIESLLEATKLGKRNEWIAQHVTTPSLENTTDAKIILDIFSEQYYNLRRLIYQCDNCGRIWIQREDTTDFIPFVPEDSSVRNVLFKEDNEFE